MSLNPLPKLLLATAMFPLLASAENLLKNASFEQPPLKGRVEARQGGSPAQTDPETTTWAHFQSMDATGRITLGLTDEIARTGKQSFYVDFAHVAKTQDAFLMSDLIAIKPGENYRISLWGRLDRKRPFTLLQARPLLRLEVEFYQADEATQTGDTQYRTQQIPGSPRRILFESGKWNEYYSDAKAPEDAAFMKITFRWEPPAEDGEADGVIYFDDAVVEGRPAEPAAPDASDSAAKPAPAVPAK